jgi:hypothetical protein
MSITAKQRFLASIVLLSGLTTSSCAVYDTALDAMRGGPPINENVYMPRHSGVNDAHSVVPAIIPRPCRPGPYDTDIKGNKITLPAGSDTGTKILDSVGGDGAPSYKSDPFEEFAYNLHGADLNTCVDGMKQLIDMRWAQFEHALNSSLSTSNFLIDATVTGLTTSIPLVPAGTKSVLGAISSGLLGTRKNFDEDILYSYSIKTILQQMRTDRAAQAALIEAHLNGNSSQYRNIYQAEADLFDYAQAGSWDHAMASLATNIAAQTAACQARLRDEQMGNTTDTLPAGRTPTSTATDPCNAPPQATSRTTSVSVQIGANNEPAADQAKVLDKIAQDINTGLKANLIGGVTVEGHSAAGGDTSATARASAVIKSLTDAPRSVPSDKVKPSANVLDGLNVVIVTYEPVDALPAAPQNDTEQKVVAAPTTPPSPPPSVAVTPPTMKAPPYSKDDLLKDAIFKTANGNVTILSAPDEGNVAYMGPPLTGGPSQANNVQVDQLLPLLKSMVAAGHK